MIILVPNTAQYPLGRRANAAGSGRAGRTSCTRPGDSSKAAVVIEVAEGRAARARGEGSR